MATKKIKPIKVYVCGIDFQHEIGNAADGNKVYPSVESLKKYQPCCENSGCGIVECEITFKRWVEKQCWKTMVDKAIPAKDLNKHLIKLTKDKIKKLQAYLERLEKEDGKRG